MTCLARFSMIAAINTREVQDRSNTALLPEIPRNNQARSPIRCAEDRRVERWPLGPEPNGSFTGVQPEGELRQRVMQRDSRPVNERYARGFLPAKPPHDRIGIDRQTGSLA
jgi:hypothetical protein